MTVFLTLILLSVMAVSAALYESVRAAGCRWYLRTAADSAAESLMAGYHRCLWDNYRVFGCYAPDKKALTSKMRCYADAYREAAAWYSIDEQGVTAEPLCYLTDSGGKYLRSQIQAYMTPGILANREQMDLSGKEEESIRQAEALGSIVQEVQGCGTWIYDLDRETNRIRDSLTRQREYMDAGDNCLRDGDGAGFLHAMYPLRQELRGMEKLVSQWKRRRETLQARKTEADTVYSRKEQALKSTGAGDGAEEAMQAVQDYTNELGQIEAALEKEVERAAANLKVLEAALERADEVMEEIEARAKEDDDNDGDDEDDDDDDDGWIRALWRSVLAVTADFERPVGKVTQRDEKKLRLLEQIGKLTDEGMLALCIPHELKVSEALTEQEYFPSLLAPENKDSGEAAMQKWLDVADGVLFAEYGVRFFPSVRRAAETAGLQYEQEYLICGNTSDRANLAGTVKHLWAVRMGINMLVILQDAGMCGEARTAAALICGGAGVLLPFEEAVYHLLLAAWSSMESAAEVRGLLAGERLPVLKRGTDWKTSLGALLELGSGVLQRTGTGQNAEKNGGKGFCYEDWIRGILLIMDRDIVSLRMLDMMQENISASDKGFQISSVASRIRCEIKGRAGALPIRAEQIRSYGR